MKTLAEWINVDMYAKFDLGWSQIFVKAFQGVKFAVVFSISGLAIE